MIHQFVDSILKAQASYRQIIQAKLRENDLDLSIGMLSILKHLNRVGSVNQQELTLLVYRDKSSLSYLIKGMEKRGLVKRVSDEKDKRSKLVTMTNEGREYYQRGSKIVSDVFDDISQEVNLEHIRQCIDYLTEFTNKVTKN